ncbi:MAG: hypothetical protein HQ518_15785 [Rhodopirellula sp.]|nr:hypothetical protein [Rhodopirellula sp.]
MQSDTFYKLQQLKGTEFHALCDSLLPRIDAAYFGITPHGRNERGDSIQGQPDSYVGDSPATCRIAIQCTTERESWWTKAVKDVADARAACPVCDEIVLALSRDVGRLPSKGKGLNWLTDAVAAAAPAKLTVLGGTRLAQHLDEDLQDLRREYLGIPFSRLSMHSLLAACRQANADTLDRLKNQGRYQPDAYVDREADDTLFGLWQQALQNASGHTGKTFIETLIPLVADSGIGKTSLLARFTERSSSQTPTLFLLARDIAFTESDSLVREVITQLHGSMELDIQRSEESHIARMIGNSPLTVVVDGLDETGDPVGVRRAIDHWLRSRLGKASVLVVASRREFWRKCHDATWNRSILQDIEHPKAAKSVHSNDEGRMFDRLQGHEIPGRFTLEEAVKAWVKRQLSQETWWQLPKQVRQELTHPFTMKAAIELLSNGVLSDELTTQTGILELWIEHRLNTETETVTRIATSLFRQSLLAVARTVARNDSGWAQVDQLNDDPQFPVPRFDSVNPPGPVVERLINASILETHPDHDDRIRFTFEVLQDFFFAESSVSEVRAQPELSARGFAALTFSDIAVQLERLGEQLAGETAGEQFVAELARHDGPMAATAIHHSPHRYSPNCRTTVVGQLKVLLNSRMYSQRAFATTILGRLRCNEAAAALQEHWLNQTPDKRVHGIVANAAISHGIVALAALVFRTWWFNDERFFSDLQSELRSTTAEFREALCDHAAQYIPAGEHSENYQRAVEIFGYLAACPDTHSDLVFVGEMLYSGFS